MDKQQALINFWSSFGIPAYDELSVPDNAHLPYLTYTLSTGEFNDSVSQYVSVWYRGAGWEAITQKAEEIVSVLRNGGKMIPCDNGAIWIRLSEVATERMIDATDKEVKRIYITLNLEFVCVG